MNELQRGERAKALLEDPMFKDACESVRQAIYDRIERCPLADVASAEDLRRCLRLLKDLKLNLEVAMKDGKLIQFRLEQDAQRQEKRKIGLIPGFFR
jgi:hypothetical protein